MNVTRVMIYLTILLSGSCAPDESDDQAIFQQSMDSVASRKIDSAYIQIQLDCDKAMYERVPLMVDSLLKDQENEGISIADNP